jgi:hypothetical protein
MTGSVLRINHVVKRPPPGPGLMSRGHGIDDRYIDYGPDPSRQACVMGAQGLVSVSPGRGGSTCARGQAMARWINRPHCDLCGPFRGRYLMALGWDEYGRIYRCKGCIEEDL